MAIVSKETIARLAETAARRWVEQPGSRPGNPFNPFEQPDHFREWNAAFTRYVDAISVPDAEGSA